MKKNKLVQLCRFLFCILIVMVHTHGLRPESRTAYPFAGGYIAVEFFLILSGFYATRYVLKNLQEETPAKMAVGYAWKQYKKVFPVSAVCIIAQYLVTLFNDKLSLQDFPYIIYEILLVPQSGIYKTFLNLPLWYLSAYFICLPILIYCIKRYSDFFVNIGSILIPLLVYGFICRVNIDLDIWSFTSNIWFIGLFRTFAGLCVGVCSYKIFLWLDHTQFTGIGCKIIKTLAVCGFISVLLYCYIFSFTYADYFLVFIMMFVLAYINTVNLKNSKLDRACYYLGDLSIYIYCSHWLIRGIVPKVMPYSTYTQMLPVYLILSIIYAALLKALISQLKKGVGWLWRNCIYDSKI